MSENVLESYLIRLGFTNDSASLNKLHAALGVAGKAVEHTTAASSRTWRSGRLPTVGAFAAIGASVIGRVPIL
jgi:hypothetical protein